MRRRLVLLTLVFFSTTHGRSSFQAKVPNGAHIGKSLGHSSGSALNAFGSAFRDAGFEWTTALCQADTDGDGKSNGFELGDPDCVWKVGDAPTRTAGITSPNDATNKAPTRCSTNKGRRLDGNEDYGTEAEVEVEAEAEAEAEAKDEDEAEDGAYVNCTQDATAAPQQGATGAPAGNGGVVPPWLIAHGVLLGLAWCVLAPIGIACALPPVRPYLGGRWFPIHRWCLFGAVALTAAGCLVPLVVLDTHGDTPHKVIGLIVLALAMLQPVNAFFRPPAAKPKEVKIATDAPAALEHAPAGAHDYAANFAAEGQAEEGKASAPPLPIGYVVETITIAGEKSGPRHLWESVHKNAGRAMVILALADVGLGLEVALSDYAR